MNGSLDIVKRFPIEKFRLVIEIQKPRESADSIVVWNTKIFF